MVGLYHLGKQIGAHTHLPLDNVSTGTQEPCLSRSPAWLEGARDTVRRSQKPAGEAAFDPFLTIETQRTMSSGCAQDLIIYRLASPRRRRRNHVTAVVVFKQQSVGGEL